MTRLCTNLPRTPFSLDLVARRYRFRWQIERCSKEWKSYANLHQFDTANPHIAEGLIWASLCAAVLTRFLAHAAQRVGQGTAMSTRRVALCAHHILDALVAALLLGVGLRGTLRRGLHLHVVAGFSRPSTVRLKCECLRRVVRREALGDDHFVAQFRRTARTPRVSSSELSNKDLPVAVRARVECNATVALVPRGVRIDAQGT